MCRNRQARKRRAPKPTVDLWHERRLQQAPTIGTLTPQVTVDEAMEDRLVCPASTAQNPPARAGLELASAVYRQALSAESLEVWIVVHADAGEEPVDWQAADGSRGPAAAADGLVDGGFGQSMIPKWVYAGKKRGSETYGWG